MRSLGLLLVGLAAAVALATIAETRKADPRHPSPPRGLGATIRSGHVVLRWRQSADDARVAGYDVWRRNDPGSNWSLIAQTRSRGYTDRAATAGKAYAYGVRAYDSAGDAESSSAIVTVNLPAVTANAGRTVVWRADAERPLNQEWAEYSTATHCAVTSNEVTSDPEAFRESSVVAQGSFAYEFVIHSGDRCYGARTEIGQGLPERAGFSAARLLYEGEDRWFAFQVRLGGDFPVNNRNWDVIAQWKQVIATAVPFPMVALQVHDGAFYLEHAVAATTASATTVGKRLGPAIRKLWVKMSVEIKFSAHPAVGFVEIYGDPGGHRMRLLMRRTHFSTLATGASGDPVPSNSRMGIYRNQAITGTAHIYFDGYTVATARSAADAIAFAPVSAVEHRRPPRRRSRR